jgi:hypothetical protein
LFNEELSTSLERPLTSRLKAALASSAGSRDTSRRSSQVAPSALIGDRQIGANSEGDADLAVVDQEV